MATSAISLGATKLIKRVKVQAPEIEVRMPETVAQILMSDNTVSLIDMTVYEQPDYSEEQFSTDLRKASKKLDLMVKRALEDDAQGKTREFPV